MSATDITLAPATKADAKVGDFLHYAYPFQRWGIDDFGLATREVVSLVTDGAGKTIAYIVEGDYRVEVKHVQSVIPMFEEARPFPLETGQ